MTDASIVAQLPLWPAALWPPKKPAKSRDLHVFWQAPETLPAFVRNCPTSMRYLDLLGSLPWPDLPERDLEVTWRFPTIPFATLAATALLKLNEGWALMGRVRRYLLEHPALIWLFGFPLVPAPNHGLGFNAQASLPTPRHLTHLLRQVPNAVLQFLLDSSVQLIRRALAERTAPPIECISLDTKHILAWVKENNPKTYVPDRFNKARQPPGDPDCRLGCP